MTKLKVEKSKREDIYKDIIRIPKRCRKTKGGKIIKEGELCLVSVPKTKKSVYAILRGCKKNQKSIFIDEYLRNKLGVEAGKEYKFVFSGEVTGSDPADKIRFMWSGPINKHKGYPQFNVDLKIILS